MTETPNELAEMAEAAVIVTPGDVTGLCKRITTWDEVVSWPGVQAAARSAVAGLRRLEIAVAIAYNEKAISVSSSRVAAAEAEIERLQAELAELDTEVPSP